MKTLTLSLAALSVLLLAGCSRTPEAKAARFAQSAAKYLDQKDYAAAILQFQNALRFAPQQTEFHYKLGIAYLAIGDAGAAVEEFQHAVELDPKHLPAQLQIMELMAASQNIDVVREAQGRAQAVLAAAPDHPQALHALALAEMRLGKPDQAELHLQQALEKSPENLKCSMTLATVRLARKDPAGAEEVLKRAADMAPRSAEAAMALGRYYALAGRLAEAEAQLRRAIQFEPRNGVALLDLANLQARSGQEAPAEQTFRRLADLPDKQYKPLHAIFLFQHGRPEEAIKEFEKLARQDREDREARTRLIAAYAAARRMPEAESVLQQALRRNPRDTEALSLRSELYVMAGKFTEAQNDLAQVLRYQPESDQAHYTLARIYQARGQPLNYRQELGEALRLNPNLLAVRVELARALLAANSAEAAVDLMDQTPSEQRRSIPALVQRNWALLATGDEAALSQALREALAVERSPELLLQDALLKLQQRDYAGSRLSLEQVLNQDPEDLRALEALAGGYIAQKQMPAAISKVQQYASRRPKSAPMQHFFGRLLLSNGNRAEARAAFAAAKAADPAFAPADLALAEMDLSEGKLDAARRGLSAVLASGSTVEGRLLLGMVEEEAGNYNTAIEHYRAVTEADPNNVVALNNLAYRLANNANQPDAALQFARQAKEIAPDNPSVSDTLGWAFYCKGIYPSALVHLEQAAAKDSGALVQYHLAMAYAKAGDRDRARQALQLALRKNPNLPEAQIARQLLASADQNSR